MIEASHGQFLVISLHKYISSFIQNQQNDNRTIWNTKICDKTVTHFLYSSSKNHNENI